MGPLDSAAARPIVLVPHAESLAGLSAPLRGLLRSCGPTYFPWGFTPNPGPPSRSASAALSFCNHRSNLWRAALVGSHSRQLYDKPRAVSVVGVEANRAPVGFDDSTSYRKAQPRPATIATLCGHSSK